MKRSAKVCQQTNVAGCRDQLQSFTFGRNRNQKRTDRQSHTQYIAPLDTFFVGRYSKNEEKKVNAISPKVIQELKSYLWPGNVRELEHLIERSVLLSTDTTLREIYLPKSRSESKNESAELSKKTLEEVERAYIIEVIKRCRGKVVGL